MAFNVFMGTMVAIYTIFLGIPALAVSIFDHSGRGVHALARLWSWLILKTGGVRLVVEGLENVDLNQSYMYMSNHQGDLDIPVMITSLPKNIRMVAKKELLKIPIFGPSMKRGGHIIIDRQNRESALRTLDETAERIKREKISSVIFPEGTRTIDGNLLPFKKGGFVLALQMGLPIVPITISGSYQIFNKREKRFRPGTIHLVIDKPISTTDYSISQRNELIHLVRETIIKNFKD